VLGCVLPFTDLMQAGARPDERWDMDETRRFGRWARRLWDGLLDHERLELR
jgi:exodeoxyribonuclease V gamma subunit